jgi:hypothetical protein
MNPNETMEMTSLQTNIAFWFPVISAQGVDFFGICIAATPG